MSAARHPLAPYQIAPPVWRIGRLPPGPEEPTWEHLQSWLRTTPLWHEALTIAAPEVLRVLEQPSEVVRPTDQRRALRTVARYLSRAHGRATPFGAFVSVGASGTLSQDEGSVLRCETRPQDDRWVSRPTTAGIHSQTQQHRLATVAHLRTARPDAAPAPADPLLEQVVRRNSTAWPTGEGELRLLQRRPSGFVAQNIRRTAPLDALWGWLETPQSLATVRTRAIETWNQPAELMDAWLADLLDAEVLVLDSPAPLTAPRPHAIVGLPIEPLFPIVSDPPALGTAWLERLTDALGHYRALHPGFTPPLLQQFIAAFQARWEDQRIPLLEACDPVLGLAYGRSERQGGDSALRGIPAPQVPLEYTPTEWPLHQQLWGALDAVWRQPAGVGVIDLATMPTLQHRHSATPAPSWPQSFAAMLDLGSGPHGIEGWLRSLGGTSAAAWIARHQDAPAVATVVTQIRAQEDAAARAGDLESATVVFEPIEAHYRAVVECPSQAPGMEIPIATTPHPDAEVLALADLDLWVEQGQLICWDRRREHRVVPRLRTAHNIDLETNPPVYRLLADLAAQGAQARGVWSWGQLSGARRLPQVRIGPLVLAGARWRLTLDEVARLRAATTPEACAEAWAHLADTLGIPPETRVGVTTDDTPEAPVLVWSDLSWPWRLALIEKLPREVPWVIHEVPVPILQRDGRAVPAECILPLMAEAPPSADRPAANDLHRGGRRGRRRVPPLLAPTDRVRSPWTSFALEMPLSQGERVVRERIGPVLQSLGHPWFWVHWTTPQRYELRVRVAGEEATQTLRTVIRQGVDHGWIRESAERIFRPEWARYGGPDEADATAAWMSDDAQWVWRLMQLADQVSAEHAPLSPLRVRVALMTQAWLDETAEWLPPELRAAWWQQQAAHWAPELTDKAGHPALLRTLQSWRQDQPLWTAVRAALAQSAGPDRVRRLSQLQRWVANGSAGGVPIGTLLRSHAHMHANRLFPRAARRHEAFVAALGAALVNAAAHQPVPASPLHP